MEKIGLKLKELNKENSLAHKFVKKHFCLKIFMFQTLVCGFVFMILIFIKQFSPIKFQKISSQIKISLNAGDKIYLVFLNLLNNIKNNVDNNNNNFEKNSNILQKHDDYVQNVKKEKIYNKNEAIDEVNKIIYDDLEQNTLDDDDVLFVNFVDPLIGGVGKISSKFGLRINPLTNKSGDFDFHNGVDIEAKNGTPIVSIADGIVLNAAFSKKSGNFLILSHANGYESRYAHCSKLLKKVGDSVKKGEKIALSGQTGNVTGPHLHFGLRQDNSWIDPKFIYPKMQ